MKPNEDHSYYDKAVKDINRLLDNLKDERVNVEKETEEKKKYDGRMTLAEASSIKIDLCLYFGGDCKLCPFSQCEDCNNFAMTEPDEAERILRKAKADYNL